MLEGIVENAISGVVRIALFIGRFLIGLVLMATGEIVLWMVTAGRRRPPWEVDPSEKLLVSLMIFELSTWIGLAVWMAIFALFNRVLIPGLSS